MVEVHPEDGQSVEEFALNLSWVAKRIRKFQNHAFGYFNGTLLVALPDTLPSEVVRDYHAKRERKSA